MRTDRVSRHGGAARARSQTGFTLIEVLVALALIAGVVTAIIAGMLTTASSSARVTLGTAADAALSGVTERIRTMPYQPCTPAGGPTPAALTSAYLAWPAHYLPPGVTFSVERVQFWDGTGFGPCTVERGAQMLRIRLAAGSGDPVFGDVVVRDPAARPS